MPCICGKYKDDGADCYDHRDSTVRDTTPPVCKLVGAASVTHEARFAYADKGCMCQDSYQGTLSGNFAPMVTSDVDTTQVGTYASHCNAEDASGNKAATVTRTIVVADTLKPDLHLTFDQTTIATSDSSDTSTLADDSVVKNPAGGYFEKIAHLNPV